MFGRVSGKLGPGTVINGSGGQHAPEDPKLDSSYGPVRCQGIAFDLGFIAPGGGSEPKRSRWIQKGGTGAHRR